MSNSYTKTAFTIPLSVEQTKFAYMVLEHLDNDELNLNVNAENISPDIENPIAYSVAQRVAQSIDDYDVEFEGITLVEFSYAISNEGIDIAHDESIELGTAALYTQAILSHFDLDIYVSIQAATVCNRKINDAFSGEAYFITKDDIDHTSTYSWVLEKQNEFLKKLKS